MAGPAGPDHRCPLPEGDQQVRLAAPGVPGGEQRRRAGPCRAGPPGRGPAAAGRVGPVPGAARATAARTAAASGCPSVGGGEPGADQVDRVAPGRSGRVDHVPHAGLGQRHGDGRAEPARRRPPPPGRPAVGAAPGRGCRAGAAAARASAPASAASRARPGRSGPGEAGCARARPARRRAACRAVRAPRRRSTRAVAACARSRARSGCRRAGRAAGGPGVGQLQQHGPARARSPSCRVCRSRQSRVRPGNRAGRSSGVRRAREGMGS